MTDVLYPDAPAAGDAAAWIGRIGEARVRLRGVVHRTPVVTSRTLDADTGAQVFLKCENMQRMGAFKIRGAWNAIACLSSDARRRGVVAYSSGNHAQAVALAAHEQGTPCVIVMPSTATAVKLDATRGYGAELAFHDQVGEGREEMAERLARERGLSLIPPFDHPDVIAGAGSAAAELFEDAGPLDLLLVPVGGGGLISGSVLAARSQCPACRVIGVEPEAGDDGLRSFRSGTRVRIDPPDTIADGARTRSLGLLTFAIIRAYVSDMTTVSDAALLDSMRWSAERLKMVMEPTAVLGLAALRTAKVEARGLRVGVIITGGNVDLASLSPRH